MAGVTKMTENAKVTQQEQDLEQRHQEFLKRKEQDFQRHKEDVRFPLRGDDKYYNARQCYVFALNIKEMGWQGYLSKDIDYVYFTQNAVTIRLNRNGETDIKRFNNAYEMFAWVQGFNACLFDIDKNGIPTNINV